MISIKPLGGQFGSAQPPRHRQFADEQVRTVRISKGMASTEIDHLLVQTARPKNEVDAGTGAVALTKQQKQLARAKVTSAFPLRFLKNASLNEFREKYEQKLALGGDQISQEIQQQAIFLASLQRVKGGTDAKHNVETTKELAAMMAQFDRLETRVDDFGQWGVLGGFVNTLMGVVDERFEEQHQVILTDMEGKSRALEASLKEEAGKQKVDTVVKHAHSKFKAATVHPVTGKALRKGDVYFDEATGRMVLYGVLNPPKVEERLLMEDGRPKVENGELIIEPVLVQNFDSAVPLRKTGYLKIVNAANVAYHEALARVFEEMAAMKLALAETHYDGTHSYVFGLVNPRIIGYVDNVGFDTAKVLSDPRVANTRAALASATQEMLQELGYSINEFIQHHEAREKSSAKRKQIRAAIAMSEVPDMETFYQKAGLSKGTLRAEWEKAERETNWEETKRAALFEQILQMSSLLAANARLMADLKLSTVDGSITVKDAKLVSQFTDLSRKFNQLDLMTRDGGPPEKSSEPFRLDVGLIKRLLEDASKGKIPMEMLGAEENRDKFGLLLIADLLNKTTDPAIAVPIDSFMPGLSAEERAKKLSEAKPWKEVLPHVEFIPVPKSGTFAHDQLQDATKPARYVIACYFENPDGSRRYVSSTDFSAKVPVPPEYKPVQEQVNVTIAKGGTGMLGGDSFYSGPVFIQRVLEVPRSFPPAKKPAAAAPIEVDEKTKKI